MTANTKMTEERAKALIEYGIRATENFDGYEHSRAKGFLEGFQAGRAEMAEEACSITRKIPVSDYHSEAAKCLRLAEQRIRIAQRDGGKK